MSITEDDLTREKIVELARLHPVVAHYYALWKLKRLTWEQASYGIILALIERNTSLAKDLLALRHASLFPVFRLNKTHDDVLRQAANLPNPEMLFRPMPDQVSQQGVEG